jgi:hypothetical protein
MPITVKTIKQQGCYFKVVVTENDSESLLVRITSLPGKIQSQELIVKLPKNKNIFFSKADFAN